MSYSSAGFGFRASTALHQLMARPNTPCCWKLESQPKGCSRTAISPRHATPSYPHSLRGNRHILMIPRVPGWQESGKSEQVPRILWMLRKNPSCPALPYPHSAFHIAEMLPVRAAARWGCVRGREPSTCSPHQSCLRDCCGFPHGYSKTSPSPCPAKAVGPVPVGLAVNKGEKTKICKMLVSNSLSCRRRSCFYLFIYL